MSMQLHTCNPSTGEGGGVKVILVECWPDSLAGGDSSNKQTDGT